MSSDLFHLVLEYFEEIFDPQIDLLGMGTDVPFEVYLFLFQHLCQTLDKVGIFTKNLYLVKCDDFVEITSPITIEGIELRSHPQELVEQMIVALLRVSTETSLVKHLFGFQPFKGDADAEAEIREIQDMTSYSCYGFHDEPHVYTAFSKILSQCVDLIRNLIENKQEIYIHFDLSKALQKSHTSGKIVLLYGLWKSETLLELSEITLNGTDEVRISYFQTKHYN